MNVPPPIESLTAESSQAWQSLCTNPSQITQRIRLRRLLDRATPYKMASDQIELYEELNNLLQTGLHDRFVLYCPLFIIPSSEWYRQHPTIDTFIELYLKAWFRLLDVKDPKADFTDGDIDGELEMVCQAAQLGQYLFAKRLINRQCYTKHTLYHHSRTKTVTLDESLTYSAAISKALINQTDYSSFDEARSHWLQREWQHQTIQALAKTTADLLLTTPYDSLGPLNDDAIPVMITALGMLSERRSREHSDRLLTLARHNPHHRQYIIRALSRMYSIGQCGLRTLEEFNIRYPKLEGPHFQHVADFKRQEQIVRTITDHYADMYYPICLTFGSQLKGYAQPSSDTDLAILAKPNVDTQIEAAFGDVTVFKTHYHGADIACDNSDIHILFNSAWTGDQATFDHLTKHLLLPSTKDTQHLLRAIEHDIIQYRLLHHGYETYNPTTTATFFDEGFRKTASKLYVSNILIP